MKALGQLMAIGLIALAAAGGTFWVKGPPLRKLVCDQTLLKAGEVCLEQIRADAKVLWIDARSRVDWKKSGIAGSILWNLDPVEDMQVFEAETAMRLIDAPWVIVYCGDENCGISSQVAERIRALQMGVEVAVLRGGWRALHEAGRITDSSRAP